jgi:hypothetical protein
MASPALQMHKALRAYNGAYKTVYQGLQYSMICSV